jgi:hypothetical protein
MTEPTEVSVFRDFTLRFPDADDSAIRRAVLDHLDALTAERDALAATLARLAPIAAEVADDLEAEIKARYQAPDKSIHPALQTRYDRDMSLVRLLRALLATVP